MTSSVQENQAEQSKSNDKELNFRALEAKYQREVEKERSGRLEAEKNYQEAMSRNQPQTQEDADDESEPYVDHKKFNRKMASFEKRMEQTIDKKAEEKARSMMHADKQDSWMRNNPDFYDVMQNAQKLYEKDQDLAETILEMPDTFERKKLVYKNIKALGLHKPDVKQPSIQEKVDANRRSPYYQPSGVGTAPYASAGDFSSSGQKNAYDQMQALKSRLRLG